MQEVLDNPVYNALISGDSPFALGRGQVKFFDEQISPFAGFDQNYKKGFDDLRTLLPDERRILYATVNKINTPKGWLSLEHIIGLQFIFESNFLQHESSIQPTPLNCTNIDEMIALALLTKPGPFGKRTIEFGDYFGIFQNEKLVAMTGQRLHVFNHSEISAVCTHPEFAGRGFAKTLLCHQVELILKHGQVPFLHVRKDNLGAITLYKKLGFRVRSEMNFYLLQKL